MLESPALSAADRRLRRACIAFMVMVAGIVMIYAGDLFFAGHAGTTFLLFLAGIVVATFAWTAAALQGWRAALVATVVAVASAVAWPEARWTIQLQSYRMYVHLHEAELARMIRMTAAVPPSTTVSMPECGLPTPQAGLCPALGEMMERLGVARIWKRDDATLLVTYAWINHHGGVRRCTPGQVAECLRHGDHVTGDWYTWAD